jgi:hypothetical protein
MDWRVRRAIRGAGPKLDPVQDTAWNRPSHWLEPAAYWTGY